MRPVTTVSGARNYTVRWGASLTTVSGTSGDYWRRYQPYDAVPKIRADFVQTLPASSWPSSSALACAKNPAQNTSVPSTDSAYVNCPVGYPAGYFAGDAPEFVTAGQTGATSSSAATTWRTQISTWCSTCHTRYNAPGGSWGTSSTDTIFNYRHPTTSSLECTKCHVAHGSNAKMPGSQALGTNFSGTYPYPGGAILSGSSRLLKVDNRGTCQQCHDPTGTVPVPTAIYP
jgi:hypothetical protein